MPSSSTNQARLISETIATYERTADQYAAASIFDWRKVRPLADFFIAKIPGGRMLEIGCGPGRDAKYFSERGLTVTAIDLTARFVEMARQLAPKAEVLRMDMRKLKFPARSFDGIWAMASFLHVPKKEGRKTLLGFRRVIKANGLLFISVKLGRGEEAISKKRYGGGVRKLGGIKFFAYYSKPELLRLLRSCGFKVFKTTQGSNRYNDTFIEIFATKE